MRNGFFLLVLTALLCSFHFSLKIELSDIWEPPVLNMEDTVFYLGQKTILPIEYDFDKSDIRPSSKRFLDTVALFMQCNPSLTVEISSHTDSRGNDKYNLKLSELRAKSVVDYLIGKGIPAERLQARGAGETEPLIAEPIIKKTKDQSLKEEFYRRNRRTEMMITGLSFKSDTPAMLPEKPGKWIKADSTLMKLMTGKSTGATTTGLFYSIARHDQLTRLLVEDPGQIFNHSRIYIPYATGNCAQNLIVLVATQPNETPSLFSENKCRVFKYDHCSKMWSEIIR